MRTRDNAGMRIELQLDLDTAIDLQRLLSEPEGRREPSAAEGLHRAARRLGLELHPTHPGQSHPLLAPFFFVEVQGDARRAAHVAEQLRHERGVEAAYVRPADQPP